MIVGTQKPIDEIWDMVKDFKRVLVFGCNTCVASCQNMIPLTQPSPPSGEGQIVSLP